MPEEPWRPKDTRLTAEIDSLAGHLPEPVDVPLGMLRAGVSEPARDGAHKGNIDAHATRASARLWFGLVPGTRRRPRRMVGRRGRLEQVVARGSLPESNCAQGLS